MKYIIIIISNIVFQFTISYYFSITLKYTPITWWGITILFCLLAPFFQRPLSAWITKQIKLHKERARRRQKYEQFKKDWHDGLIPEDEFEETARQIVKE